LKLFRRILTACLLASALAILPAAEFNSGKVRLIIHENTSRFSLYYLADESRQRYEPMFSSQDPRTSFFTVFYNDRTFKLGDSSAFIPSITTQNGSPVIVFTSSFLVIRQAFEFIRTPGAAGHDGIKITVTVENSSQQSSLAGLRFLLDTSLGESPGKTPFYFDGGLAVTGEFRTNGDLWISRGDTVSLMGSIVPPDASDASRTPDFVHFANWKKLSDAYWIAHYTPGRSFDLLPYSIRDSAAAYYYDAVPLQPGQKFEVSIYLAAENPRGFTAFYETPPASEQEPEIQQIPVPQETTPEPQEDTQPEIPQEQESVETEVVPPEEAFTPDERTGENEAHVLDDNIRLLRSLQLTLDLYISGRLYLTEEDLDDIENRIKEIRNHYGL
jgi:hypothetical protein